MRRLEKVFRSICVLPTWSTFMIAVPAFILVIYVLTAEYPSMGLQVTAYVFSAYGLVLITTWSIRLIIALRRDRSSIPAVRWINENPLTSRMIADQEYRTQVLLLSGLIVNLLYVGAKLTLGVITHSLWFVFIAIYYLTLTLMKVFLLQYMTRHHKQRDRQKELRLSRLCGALLLVMNQILVFIIFMVVYLNRSYDYPGFLVYVMAVYSFYSIIAAVINLTKQLRQHDSLLSVLRVISLTTAMVSIFSLETALLSQFGQNSAPLFRQIMTGCTGTVICLCVLAMAIMMITQPTRKLRQTQISIEGKAPYE